MPIRLESTQMVSNHVGDLKKADYGYKYPRGLDLKPGSPLHDRIRDLILSFAQKSHDRISSRYDSWNKIDQVLTAYIPLDDAEEKVQNKDSRKPVSIVVPLSYATLDTLLTYVVAAFLDSPIFKYDGVGPEDVLGARLLERVVDHQARRAKMALQLHTMFRDAFAYGFGAVNVSWRREHGFRTVKGDDGFFSSVLGFVRKGSRKFRERRLIYEGNELQNIDPYSYLPDVGVPIQDVQRGQATGWSRRENRMEVLEREAGDDTFFNGQYVDHISGGSFLSTNESDRDRYGVGSRQALASMYKNVDVIYMYMDIIPKELGVGTSPYPEKWLFGLAGDSVLIKADPQGEDHGKFPLAICAPDFDGYTVTPISRLEMTYGMQHLVNFLYNSHVTNIRKALNDMFVADPELVNLNDLNSPSAGKVIRLRRKAWGRGVTGAVEQLKVVDVTSGNLMESTLISQAMDQYTGAVDSLKGQLRQHGERVSATEYRGTHASALSRLERSARIGGLQAIVDIGYMLAMNTQQFMERGQYVEIIGRGEEDLREEFGDARHVYADPLDLLVDYDVVASDGSLPNSGDPALWKDLLQVITTNDALVGQFDVVNIFKHVARLMGAKNINDFVQRPVNAQVLPDEQVAREAEKGNLVPATGEVG